MSTRTIHWTEDTKTMKVRTDVPNFFIEFGQQMVIRVKNNNQNQINIGTVVYLNGSDTFPTLDVADYTSYLTSEGTLGFVAHNMSGNTEGYVITKGIFRGVDLSNFSNGDELYLYSGGTFTNVRPIAPLPEVYLGTVVKSGIDGIIDVNIELGFEIEELHNVKIDNLNDGDVLTWDNTNSVWVNKSSTGGVVDDLTVTGNTIVNTLSATTIYATTYQNLPTDVSVTGASYNNNTFTFTNNTGGTFDTSFNTVTGLTINGNLNVTGTTSANVISATTYQNLPANVTITGGTYNAGTATFNNNTGGTFNVTGFFTGATGSFGISNSSGVYTFYSTLRSAMTAATAGQTIEMFADVTETSGTAIDLKPGVTIQGNGHTYKHTSTTGNTFNVTTTGTYNFMNINIKRNVTTPGASSYIFACSPGGAFYQSYTLFFQGSYVEYTWSTSTGVTQITGPAANASAMYIDGIRAFANGSGTMFASARIQTLKNSIIENSGTGGCFSSDNITGGSYIENSHLKTNSGTAAAFNYAGQGDAIRNCTIITASGIGVAGGTAYDTSSFSSTNRAFSGVNCFGCIGSTGSGTVYYTGSAFNSTGVSSTGYVLTPFFTLSSFYNCSLYSAGNIAVYDTGYSAALYNCSIISGYNNAAGHAISLAGAGVVVTNCYVSVVNSSANCLKGTSAITAKYSNNTFAGATTPVNANVTQGVTNTQDNQGNITL